MDIDMRHARACGSAHRDAPLSLPPIAILEYAVVLIADSILARSTR